MLSLWIWRLLGRVCLPCAGAIPALALAGCIGPDDVDVPPGSPPQPLRVVEEGARIVDADGATLLHIADMPRDVPVEGQAHFGAARRFEAAAMAPDGEWLGLVSSGAAHSAGWLLRTGTRTPQPAAFQYGGDVSVGPWREDARYLVFVRRGPAGDRLLTMVDRQRLADTVSETAIPVRIPGHGELAAERRIYEDERWQDGALHFRVGGEAWRLDPTSETAHAVP